MSAFYVKLKSLSNLYLVYLRINFTFTRQCKHRQCTLDYRVQTVYVRRSKFVFCYCCCTCTAVEVVFLVKSHVWIFMFVTWHPAVHSKDIVPNNIYSCANKTISICIHRTLNDTKTDLVVTRLVSLANTSNFSQSRLKHFNKIYQFNLRNNFPFIQYLERTIRLPKFNFSSNIWNNSRSFINRIW